MTEEVRGDILPFKKVDGKLSFATPRIVQAMVEALKTPGRAARGEVDEEEAVNFALNLMGAGTAFGAAPRGSVGMFVGRLTPKEKATMRQVSTTIDALRQTPNYRKAVREAFADTGMLETPHGWALEISDAPARIRKLPARKNISREMRTSYLHPELYERYPELGSARLLKHDFSDAGSTMGDYQAPSAWAETPLHRIRIAKALAESGDTMAQKDLLTHELQHGVQRLEGWQGGANTEYYARRAPMEIENLVKKRSQLLRSEEFRNPALQRTRSLEDALYELDKDIEFWKEAAIKPYQAYRRTAGEVEARLAGRRSSLSPETSRRIFPYEEFPEDFENGPRYFMTDTPVEKYVPDVHAMNTNL